MPPFFPSRKETVMKTLWICPNVHCPNHGKPGEDVCGTCRTLLVKADEVQAIEPVPEPTTEEVVPPEPTSNVEDPVTEEISLRPQADRPLVRRPQAGEPPPRVVQPKLVTFDKGVADGLHQPVLPVVLVVPESMFGPVKNLAEPAARPTEPKPLPVRKVEEKYEPATVVVEEGLVEPVEPKSPTAQRLAALAAAKPTVETIEEPPPRRPEAKPELPADLPPAKPEPMTVVLRTPRWPYVVMAIAVLALLGLGAWLFFSEPNTDGKAMAKAPTSGHIIDETARKDANDAMSKAEIAQEGLKKVNSRVNSLENAKDGLVRVPEEGLRFAEGEGICPYATKVACIDDLTKRQGTALVEERLITHDEIRVIVTRNCARLGCN